MSINYHAHIYFAVETFELLKDSALETLSIKQKSIHSIVAFSTKVGPHPLPMIELSFKKPFLDEITTFLREKFKEQSILIHEDTGNDIQDHTHGAIWLGQKLHLDFVFFEKVAQNPALAVHPKT